MRIWSVHPCYLDSKGLVALWREAILAKHVLEGKTKGYKNHPQLKRFKTHNRPVDCINKYLSLVYNEAESRGFNFNKDKIQWNFEPVELTVTKGQLRFEIIHLKKKLEMRNISKFTELAMLQEIQPHPLFKIIDGKTEEWEYRSD